MVLQILIARWCLAGRIVLSAVVPLNITMIPLENGDKRTVSHSSCPPFLCCLLAPMPEHLVKFNPSQTRQKQGLEPCFLTQHVYFSKER